MSLLSVLCDVSLFVISDGFGETGRDAADGFPAVPPNATLMIDLECVSWKKVEKVTDDGRVMKKVTADGEGYERPNDGSTVHGELKEYYL